MSKCFGSVLALRDISLHVDPGTVTCVLGDNGAGKSTLIKILSGVHQPTEGELLVNGEPTTFSSPRDALGAGIATVFQDLATVPADVGLAELLPRQRAAVGVRGRSSSSTPARPRRVCREELLAMGIDIRDMEQPVGTLSGGERQAVAIARAVYFGAKVLILDEPTSALGVRQSGVVLKYILQARERGIAVVFITHNPHHAHMVGDRFYLLNRGQMTNEFERKTVTREELVKAMSGWRRARGAGPRARGSSADRGQVRHMETLKVGIIGAGWMGHVHARAYQRLGQHWPDLAVRPSWSRWRTRPPPRRRRSPARTAVTTLTPTGASCSPTPTSPRSA